MSMYLVSNEELNTLVRRRRLDALDWVREAAMADTNDQDQQLIDQLLTQVERQVRSDNIGYDYQEREESPISTDEFAALEEDDGEDDTAIDFALAHVEEDNTLSMLEDEEVHADLYPEFPSQHLEVAQYTAEDSTSSAVEEVAAPEAPAPALSEEERNKRNAARQRLLNREIAQIDSDR